MGSSTNLKSSIKDVPTKNVLVVDDDTSTEILWQTVLQAMNPNIRIDWATNEKEASALIGMLVQKNLFYDLVIADIFLSGAGTGLDLWEKATPAQRERFIIVSAVDPSKIEEYLRDHGTAPNFLHKPLNIDVAVDAVEKIFAHDSHGDIPVNSNTLSGPET